MVFRPSKKSKSGATPLRGVIAFVNTVNEDGSDSSEEYISPLKSLGAIVATSFGEDITHLIWSNGKQTRLAAAIVMGIRVVLPGWIDKCRESNKMAEVDEYLITTGLVASTAAATALSLSKSPSSSSGHRSKNGNSSATSSNFGNLRISSFQNLHSICSQATAAAEINLRNGRRSPSYSSRCASCSSSTKPSRISADCNTLEVDCLCKMKQDIISSSRSTAHIDVVEGVSCHPFIPLPSYREHNTGVLPVELKVHRRSERICDLEGESSVTIDMPETLEDVLRINPDTPMAIIRVEEWPPGEDITTIGDKSCCRQLIKDQDRSEDLGDANIVIAVTGWTEADEEESESNQKHVASVREQITCLADRIYLSLCSTGVNSCRKSKEKGGRRSLTLNNTSEPPSPSPVHASRAVILSAPEDPLGITCTHLVCPLRLTALSSKRVLFALARGIPIVTTDWVTECSSKLDWRDPGPFLCVISQNKKERKIFEGRTFYLGRSRHPSPKTIKALIELLGGSVMPSLKAAELMVLGDQDDAAQWMDLADSKLNRRAHSVKDNAPYEGAGKVGNETLNLALGMAKKRSVLTWKYLCDCVLENEALKPSTRSGHLLSFKNPSLPLPLPLPVPALSEGRGTRTRVRDLVASTHPEGSGVTCTKIVKRHSARRSPTPLEPPIDEEQGGLSMESGSQRSKPRSAGVTVTATTASSVSSCCAKSRGRPFKSQPSLIPQTTVKATGKLKEVQPQKVVIMREMTRYRGVKGDNGSSPAVGLPKKDESALEEVPTRHKKRKRSGLDVDTDFAPTVTAAGRVGRVGRPDSPTW